MRLRRSPPLHLTYCTNIHPAEGWAATDATLRRVVPALKARLSPGAPFGLGLRLGAREARELLEPGRLADFQAFLDEEGLYVAIVNGFPYGPFHGEPVKTNVYAPDWRADARVAYTQDLAAILSRLLPEDVDGGISTVPLSYKAWTAPSNADWERIVVNVVRVAERLVRIRRDTGRLIHLDIEPEPDCLLETSEEAVGFFEGWLWPVGAPDLAHRLGTTADEAGALLRDHVQLCFDCCHCAVEYEDPAAAFERLRRAGIRIGRVQLSSALTADLPPDAAGGAVLRSRLEAFADSTYLHQVIERSGGQLRRFSDLDVALEAASPLPGRSERAAASEPRERSGATKRDASERVGGLGATPGRSERAAASEPRERSGATKRDASERVGGPGATPPDKKEWRIHFHVPLFTAEYEGLGSSQDVVRAVLNEARRSDLTGHLEIETYTWSVLPERLRVDIQESIAREFEWVLREWSEPSSSTS